MTTRALKFSRMIGPSNNLSSLGGALPILIDGLSDRKYLRYKPNVPPPLMTGPPRVVANSQVDNTL